MNSQSAHFDLKHNDPTSARSCLQQVLTRVVSVNPNGKSKIDAMKYLRNLLTTEARSFAFLAIETIGMMELHMSASMSDTMRSPLVCMVLLAWYLVVTYLVGAGCQKSDLSMCRQLLAPLIKSYPDGAIVLFLRARFFLVSGNLDTAIFFYNKSIEAQDVYHQFHHICYWELLFAYSYMRRWDRAANHAKRLLDQSRWSRCVYTYMLAILINADTTVSINKRSETVRMLLVKIPSIRLRIAGKSIPVEKFAERKAQRYLRRGNLYYPHYEFMYFWNGFSILDGHPNFVRPILDDIESTWRSNPNDDPDDESLYLFLMGVCYRSLKENYKAEDCFLRVMENEKRLTDHFYLAPNACFELALVSADLNRAEEVEVLLARARAYKGYSLETKLHFRIHCAMEKYSGARTPIN
uniref:Tetratricopeptide repeat protein 39B n=1 Tax=Ditylenchus dipsaci TaxID=166011 RepID=A0A915EQV1_9BILA